MICKFWFCDFFTLLVCSNGGYIMWVYVVFYFLCQFECLKFGNKYVLLSVLYKKYLADIAIAVFWANKWHKSAIWKNLPTPIWMEIEA